MARASFLKSFSHAWRGLRLAFRTERSFRIQIAAALTIMVAIAIFPLFAWERAALLFVTLLVLVLELLNSSIERMVDLAKPRLHEYAGDIKDLMAGAVLLASFFAVLIGALILWPHVLASVDRL